ncbi:MAG TPA: metallophosphoesterase family protein, partial [Candidatus Glassbacteria bacterium]|nr:metallophosphoesterase family protein [Candidatus Glassbacteria bacterium]
MLLALISDIHSNLQALEAVLGRIEAMGIEEVVCLGDVVGYGADPNA